MVDIFYAFDEKPLSHNKRGVAAYKNKLVSDFNSKFAHHYSCLPFPIGLDLQTDILYIDGVKSDANRMDIDNLSKPLIDCFTGVIYSDDKQIVRRTATRYKNSSYDLTELDFTDIPQDIYLVVANAFFSNKEHIVVLKVSEIDLSSFGGKFL